MSIKFVCPCGKRLKARDDMAARRIMCPRCGNPVGVPSLDPNRPTPMTPAERLRAHARRPITLSHLDEEESEHSAPSTQDAGSQHSDQVTRHPAPLPRSEHSVLSTEYSVLGTPPAPLEKTTSPITVPPPRPAAATILRLTRTHTRQRHYDSQY